ncbi:MAG: peptide deformylase [Haliscomenobacteraceae bacterium CHB4]|nr:Peptide deformylase [Saprospiraceae bacterium]MCE7926595.1 peptide deformylase [Haliscomenobacteraceae bacterium CHB4]
MLLPIYAYGHPVLKKIAASIGPDFPDLQELIANMWETMYHAEGVGIAAPQVGVPIRLFVIDTLQIEEDDEKKPDAEKGKGFKKVFINAQKVEETGNPWTYEEGCLSIPRIRGDVERPQTIRLRYMDENFVEHEETFTGVNARVVQHEYDHIEGILFTEKLKPLKKRLIQRKLEDIRVGKIKTDYKMKFAVAR